VTFFVDANIIVYSASRGEHQNICLEVLAAVASGAADGRTSAGVLEEVWHLERSGKIDGLDGLAEHASTIFAPLLAVSDGAFRRALAIDAPRLGTNDRLHVGTCLEHGIDTIFTADADFDASDLRRVDPANVRATRRLLNDR
jgi:predicted nucleic acid-binding protein